MSTNKVKPTTKQLATLKVLKENPDMPLGEAMIKGGYDQTSSLNPTKNFVEGKGTQTALQMLGEEYARVGITIPYLAKKTAQWLEAQKPFSSHTEPDKMIDDYQTQLRAAEFVREDMGLKAKDSAVAIQINTIVEKKRDDYGI